MSSDLSRQTRERQDAGGNAAARSADLQRKIGGQRAGLAAALADRIGPERFIRAAATEIRTTKHLAECTDESLLGALYVAAQLGLEPGGPRGLVYLVPYRNSKTNAYEAQMIVGYKGWVDLFYRAGARAVQWFLIRQGDTFRIASDAVRGKVYQWEQADPNSSAPVTGAVAQVVTGNGGIVWEYLSAADIAKRSTGTPFWQRWPDEMSLKTVMRRLAATAPLSEDLILAQAADETVQRRVEVPGMGAEHVVEHVPVTGERPAVEARPTPRPAVPTVDSPVQPDSGPEDEPDWLAAERAEADAYLAGQEDAQ